ncbi:MAG: flagellar hook-basal body protein [Syntrophomonadaceae bacterium]|nr:flagellar hook-basal body protein [Syntrophomonadaceae bacterium]
MIKGLYTAAAGMMNQMARQDVVANNLANVSTAGFKKSTAVTGAFPEMLMSRLGEVKTDSSGRRMAQTPVVIGTLGTGAAVSTIHTDYSMGHLKGTSNYTDLALGSDGYFVVETPEGIRYTRSGEFKISVTEDGGMLTTSHGFPVLDTNGERIFIEGEFSVDSRGIITYENEEYAQLGVYRLEDPQAWEKLGDNLFNAENPEPVDNAGIKQGFLEESNANAVEEMVTLISVVRAYEALQKVVQAEDELNQVAIDEVGRV